ncbi:MAG: type II toxin-antitoxin system RelE/ParE family toxin [FCB group bacterium]|jgi:hypothetical protein|nr:type II toxin-antitoxin system RelE/ParE family toxin [FCB group bacterium]
MKFFFHPRANAELDEAIRYYENCQLGLGLDLAEEVYLAIRRACEYPEAWSAMSQHTRRCLVNRFPYGVIFQIKSGMLRVIAIASLHRRPDYWTDRI